MKPLKTDLHIHSQFSDGQLSVAEIVDLYGAKGYGAIAITDHLCERGGVIGHVSRRLNLSLTEEKFSCYMETLWREKERAQKQYGMLLVPGFEITKNSFFHQRGAHVLILGITDFIDPDLGIEEILYEAKAKNALTIAAHPFLTGDFEFQTLQLWEKRNEWQHLIDLWEVNYRQKIFDHVLNSGLPLVASSDFHRLNHFNSWKTIVHSTGTESDFIQALREQRVELFYENNPISQIFENSCHK
ncbi:PHP domain-containing protein [Pseudobdellovibrio sp. HCB154]|uniref:PHP domain-containing protein n=1 Tax=Pseudobdellovibrio sp. HCB154 TaxID=3386277 RepID=UPI0039173BE7